MKCEKCGKELQDSTQFCESCGHPANTNAVHKQPKKKKGCLIGMLSFLGAIGIILVCIAIFLPGFFGPKDLEIKTSKKAYESAISKMNYQKDAAPTTGVAEDYTYTYGELKKIKTGLTSEELTSFFNYNRPKYYALKKVQIRINPDDTVEFSGAIDMDYLLNKVLGGKYGEQDIVKAFPLIKVIPGSINVYAQFSGGITENKSVSFVFSDIVVMGIGLPSSLYNTESAKMEISNLLDNFLTKTIEKTKGTYESVKVENGELTISGNLPSSLKREEVN